MTMSTQTLTEAAGLLARAVLRDQIQISNAGPTVTTGIHVTRELTPVGEPVQGIVQTLKPQYALEGLVVGLFAVKVAKGTALEPGQVVTVLQCAAEPDLVGKSLLVDRISLNGLSMLRRGICTDFVEVDEQGKDTL